MASFLLDAWGPRNRPLVVAFIANLGALSAAQIALSVVDTSVAGKRAFSLEAAAIMTPPLLGLLLSWVFPRLAWARIFGATVVVFGIAIALFAWPEIRTVASAKAPQSSVLRALFTHCPGLAGATLAGLVLTVALGVRALGRGEAFRRASEAVLGDATWLAMAEAAKLFPGNGEVVIGEAYRPDLERRGHEAFDPANRRTWGSGGLAPLLTYKLDFDSTHMLFFAGSGGYKTTSTVVPTALRYHGSMVVLDPAREVGHLVGRHRVSMPTGRIRQGRNGEDVPIMRSVKLLDPTRDDVEGCDVLEPIVNSTSLLTDAVAFARLLTAESARRTAGSDQYFEQQALNLMTGLLVYVLVAREFETTRKLDDLRKLTSLTETKLKAKIAEIVAGAAEPDAPSFVDQETYRRFLAETLGPYVHMADQTFTGIASSVAKDTQWLSIASLRAMVCGESFRVSDLPNGELDVFIQMPGDLMKSYPGVCRTLIGSFMKAMERAEGRYAKRVLFVLDEVDLLGYMSLLEEARDRGRKFGMTLMMLYQSVGQLEKHFGKDGATSWFEGAAFTSYAAIKSRETAEHLSKQIGDVTVEVEGRSRSTSWMDGLFSANASHNARLTNSVSLQKRPLILPHEIREMRADEQIILVRGYPALRAGRAIYFRRPEMLGKTAAPLFAGRRSR